MECVKVMYIDKEMGGFLGSMICVPIDNMRLV